jgi:hypothetical protein
MEAYSRIKARTTITVDELEYEIEIEVETDTGKWKMVYEPKRAVDDPITVAELEAAAAEQLGGECPIDLFFHINDDGSVAIATGEAPDVWPEDEIE